MVRPLCKVGNLCFHTSMGLGCSSWAYCHWHVWYATPRVALLAQVNPPAGWAEKYYEALAVRLCLGSGRAPPDEAGDGSRDGAEQLVEGSGGGGSNATSEQPGQPCGQAGELTDGTVGNDLGPRQGQSEQPVTGNVLVGEQLGQPQEHAGQSEAVQETGKAEGDGLVEAAVDGEQEGGKGAGRGGVQSQGLPTLRRYQINRMPQQPEQLSLVELLRMLRGLERLSGLGAPPPADLVAALQEGLAAHLSAFPAPVPAPMRGSAVHGAAPVAGGRPDGRLGEEEEKLLLQIAGVGGRERVGGKAGGGGGVARDGPVAVAVWLAEVLTRSGGAEDTSGVTAAASQQQQQQPSPGAAGGAGFAPREVVLAALERAHILLLERHTAALTSSSSSLQGDAVTACREPPTAALLLAQARVLRAALGRPVGLSWWVAATSLLVSSCSAQLQGVVEAAALGKEHTARGLSAGVTAAGVAEMAAAVRGEDNRRAMLALAAANELLEFLGQAATAGIPAAGSGTWTLGMAEGGDGDDGGGAGSASAVGGPAGGPAYSAMPAAWWRAASFAARKCILGSRRPWARRDRTAQAGGRTQGRGKEAACTEGTVSADGSTSSTSSSGGSNRPPDSVLLPYAEVAEQTTRYAQHLGRWLEAQREAVAAGPQAEAAAGAGTAAVAAAYAAGVAVAKAHAAAPREGSHGVAGAGLVTGSYTAGGHALRVDAMPAGLEVPCGDSERAEVAQGAGGLGQGEGIGGGDAVEVVNAPDSANGGGLVNADSGLQGGQVEQEQRLQQGDDQQASQPTQANSAGASGTGSVASGNPGDRTLAEEEGGEVHAEGSTSAGGSSTNDGQGDGNNYDALKKTHLSFLLDMCSLQLSAMRADAHGRLQRGGGAGTAAQDAGQDAALTAAQGVRLAELLARTRFKPVHFQGLEGWPAAYMAQVCWEGAGWVGGRRGRVQ